MKRKIQFVCVKCHIPIVNPVFPFLFKVKDGYNEFSFLSNINLRGYIGFNIVLEKY